MIGKKDVFKRAVAALLSGSVLLGTAVMVPMPAEAAAWVEPDEAAPQPVEENELLWLPVSYTMQLAEIEVTEAEGVVSGEGITLCDGSARIATTEGVRIATVPPKMINGVLYAPSRLLKGLFPLNISQSKDGTVKVSRSDKTETVDDSWYYDWLDEQPEAAPEPQTAVEILERNVRSSYYNSSGSPDSILELMDRDGSFKDLDYTSSDMNSWDPGKHLSRLETLVAICYTPTNPHYKDPDLMAKVVLSLEYWFNGKFVGSAWWNNRGVAMSCQNLCLFPIEGLSDKTAAELKRRCAGYDDSWSSNDHYLVYGGVENGLLRTWTGSGQGVATKAISSLKLVASAGDSMTLEEKEKTIKDCISAVSDELEVIPYAVGYNPGDVVYDEQNIQTDFSFHEHGHGNLVSTYGSAALCDLYVVLGMLSGTGYNLSDTAAEKLQGWLLDGFRYVYKNNYYLQQTSGRQPALPDGSLTSLTPRQAKIFCCDYLLRYYPDMDRRAELLDYINMTVSSEVNGHFSGTRYYWHSELLAHNRPGYLFAVTSVSTRTNRPEKANDSNILAMYEGDGFYEILKRGNENSGLAPVYDWRKMAGVTAVQDSSIGLNPADEPKGTTTFCGGVSDGEYGFSVYDLDHLDVKGKKSWFCFDDEIVCLGAGITSSNGNNVFTGVNQTRLWGDVVTDSGTITAEKNEGIQAQWVLHDGIGYVFEGDESLTLEKGSKTGSWAWVNNEQPIENVTTADVFLLGINHGGKPQNASYSYAILPETDEKQLSSYVSSRPYEVCANTAECQAVYHKKLNIFQAVFYKPGSVTAPNGQTISADAPCAVMLRTAADGSYQLSAANPDFKKLKVTVNCSGPVSTSVVFDLQEGYRGNDSGKTFIYDSKTDGFLADNNLNLLREQSTIEEPAALLAVSVNGKVYDEKTFFNTSRRVREMSISELPEIKAKGNYPVTIETDDEKTVITVMEEGNPDNKVIYLIEYTWRDRDNQ